jgi:hypothetical protein
MINRAHYGAEAASNRDALPEFILFGDSLPITVFTSTAKRLNRPQGR